MQFGSKDGCSEISAVGKLVGSSVSHMVGVAVGDGVGEDVSLVQNTILFGRKRQLFLSL